MENIKGNISFIIVMKKQLIRRTLKKIKDNIVLFFTRMREETDLYYVVEDANWAVAEEGKNIVGHLTGLKGILTTKCRFISKDPFIHLGSFNVLLWNKKICRKRKGKKIIATCFHIADGDPRADEIIRIDQYIEKWHTSCNITKDKLIRFGVDVRKIYVIPIGIDRTIYFPESSVQEREKHREQIGVKKGQIVIGSFQKDGNGWDEGLEPKLIKGPDIFCDVVEKLALEYDIFVLLSGPARGYVKGRLQKANIPYYHVYMENANDIAKLYRMIDIYLVTSREEGGPKAILESMASGIPIISTKVGQALDIIENGDNGFLVDIGDVDAIVHTFGCVVNSEDLRKKIVSKGLSTAEKYDMSKIVARYEHELYSRNQYV